MIENFAKVIEIANKDYDGHFTIFKFTTGYKVVFGTPGMDVKDRKILYKQVPQCMDLDKAFLHAIAHKPVLNFGG